jgi:peptidoglycan/LPS O-acetylase OafA/YrhL
MERLRRGTILPVLAISDSKSDPQANLYRLFGYDKRRFYIGLKLDNVLLVRLGVVSYGLYVYHELLLIAFQRILPSSHGWGFVLWWLSSLTATVITALASCRVLESPFLRLKERFAIVKSRPM